MTKIVPNQRDANKRVKVKNPTRGSGGSFVLARRSPAVNDNSAIQNHIETYFLNRVLSDRILGKLGYPIALGIAIIIVLLLIYGFYSQIGSLEMLAAVSNTMAAIIITLAFYSRSRK